MNGNSVVLDTNIVLYLLSGDKVLSELLYQKKLYLSFISQLELLAFNGITDKQQNAIEKFINDCVVIDINDEIKSEVIAIRKIRKLKLPDCIVLATAHFLNMPLITSDVSFKIAESPEIIIYKLV